MHMYNHVHFQTAISQIEVVMLLTHVIGVGSEQHKTMCTIIKEFRCYEAKIEESEKGRQSPGVKPRTPLA